MRTGVDNGSEASRRVDSQGTGIHETRRLVVTYTPIGGMDFFFFLFSRWRDNR